MNILLPLDSNNEEEAKLTKIDDAKFWALITLNEGRTEKIDFYSSKEEIEQWIDCVIVISDQEYVWPFIEENIAVLLAPVQRYIDDIIEAFLFKELHDMNI